MRLNLPYSFYDPVRLMNLAGEKQLTHSCSTISLLRKPDLVPGLVISDDKAFAQASMLTYYVTVNPKTTTSVTLDMNFHRLRHNMELVHPFNKVGGCIAGHAPYALPVEGIHAQLANITSKTEAFSKTSSLATCDLTLVVQARSLYLLKWKES